MTMEELKDFVYQRKFNAFPVVDSLGRLTGILSLSDYQSRSDQDRSLSAQDIATCEVITVTEDETLLSALNKITLKDFAILPVVNSEDPTKLLGVISRRDIMTAFSEAIAKKKSGGR